ncbi:MAG: ParB/RepB/Spo0J family partition protein [Candidatus Fibromonas sp.]|jgi:ParB family chromosome partitioning protein|nr:ParB/RepB/Spo0J family partition protein [Candidatus Fibromonas sp.]
MGKKLGIGFGQILSDHTANMESIITEKAGGTAKIPLNLVDANPYQPRKVFNEEALQELAESIKQHGILEPVLLRKNAGRYQIVSGERRVRAAKKVGLNEIEARVFDLLSDKTMAEWAIIENIQREDLDPIEAANAYQQLLESYGYTHEDLATKLNKSRTAVTNSLRLLKLPEQVKKWIGEGKLSATVARSLLSPNIGDPVKAAREIIEKGLSARDAEILAQEPEKKKAKEPGVAASGARDPDMQNFLNILQNVFGTKVVCRSSRKNPQKGTLIITYSSYDDLTRIQQAVI